MEGGQKATKLFLMGGGDGVGGGRDCTGVILNFFLGVVGSKKVPPTLLSINSCNHPYGSI